MPKHVSTRNACPASAYVERFRQFNEFRTCCVRTSQEDGDLESNTRMRPRLQGVHALFPSQLFQREVHEDSTLELVQSKQVECQCGEINHKVKPLIFNPLMASN
jgi:hypothetical protein